MAKYILILFTVGFSFLAQAQWDVRYDKDLLSKEFHKGRRDALRALMPDSSVAVFFANPIRNRANDVDFQFSQDPDFYYLTGLNETDAMLIVFKENIEFEGSVTNELLYVQPRNPFVESWTGRRLGVDGVKEKLGFKVVLPNTQFAELKTDFNKFQKVYHPKFHDDIRNDARDKGDLYSMIKTFKDNTAESKGTDHFGHALMMAKLREIKLPEEMTLLRKAVNITCEAHLELMKALEPDMTEYEAQAILEYYFKKNGSEYPGYPSIVGGGENSCILHYSTNRKPLTNKDLLLFDAGAEYHGYTADVTRTIPVKGVYSPEEKIIYNIVLEAQEEGIKACRKGNSFRAAHVAAENVIKKRLKEIGVLQNERDFMKYFFHGTSHYLGLDVHDPGLYGKLMPGAVITVEPGVYIAEGSPCDKKWWNIGVRIEDDILITEGDPENLSGHLPRKIEEIEKIMKETSIFNKKTPNNNSQGTK